MATTTHHYREWEIEIRGEIREREKEKRKERREEYVREEREREREREPLIKEKSERNYLIW